jgi:NitT/TauT family transport system substrate-binding protein
MLMRLALLGLAAVTANPALAQAPTRIVVGLPAPWGVQSGYILLADRLGFFREEGLVVERVAVTGSAVLLPQVAAGQVTFGYANPDLTIIALARGEPLPVRFVMNWLRSQTFEFVVPEASPLRTIADLKGKRLGVGALTWGNLPLSRAMLASVGVAWQRDVEILPVGLGAAAWRRMQTGEVDALNLFVSEHERMAQAGIAFRRLPMPEPFRSIFSNGWVTNERMIAQQPAVVAGFARATIRGWLACKANPEACVRAWYAVDAASRPPAGQEAERLRADLRIVTVDAGQIDDFPVGQPRRYGEYPDGAWQGLIQVMHAEGQIARADLDLARLFTNRFLEEANRFDAAATEALARAAN